ncbi:MAG: rhodanese-like domain-containing protein [Maritimibacter sp.]|jgi:rhodanese-related sulfurtransferase
MANLSKRNLLIAGGAALVLAGIGFKISASGSSSSVEFKYMSVAEMQENGGLIVDIRTPQEWVDTGVIDGAKLVTFQDPQSFLAQIGPDLSDDQDLILICRSGNRSGAAAKILDGKIPNHIISVDGGMKREISEGYQTVAPK